MIDNYGKYVQVIRALRVDVTFCSILKYIYSSFSQLNSAESTEYVHIFYKILGGHKSFLLGYWYPLSWISPVNLLAASMAAKMISSIYLWPGTEGAQTGDL